MPAKDQGSVTRWLGDLRQGNPKAAQKLWVRYFEGLVRLARRTLRQSSRPGAADEEDAALSAFDGFCREAAAGRFPRLDDRQDLWRLLVALTERKAIDQLRRERRLKRGGGQVYGEAELDHSERGSGALGLDRLVSPEPSPEFAAMVVEEFHRLLERLGDDELRRIATWKLEGLTVDEDLFSTGLRPAHRGAAAGPDSHALARGGARRLARAGAR